ncbi:MAG TPA: hypothetical protein VMU01_08150 [Rhizomicrobium sp.]|nr:hypothetical protein [Rhizomicrobium sp.]
MQDNPGPKADKRAANPDATDLPRLRQMKYEQQVSLAIAQGRYWDMLWAELARDYNAAMAGVLRMWRQVDTHFSRSGGTEPRAHPPTSVDQDRGNPPLTKPN